MQPNKNIQILIVDHHEATRKMIVQMLQKLGYVYLHETGDTEDAMALLSSIDIELVLTSLELPSQYGLEFVEDIRSHPRWNQLPILMITADDKLDTIIAAIKVGINDYLVKSPSFNESLLESKIDRIFSGKSFFRANREIYEYLKNSRLFERFSDDMLAQIVPLSDLHELPEGTEVLKEGTRNNKVYFLLRGVLAVYCSGEKIIELQRKGDIIGEMSVISEKPCAATVVTKTPVELFSIQAQDIGRYLELESNQLQNTLYRLFAMVLTEKLSLTTHKAQRFETTNRALEEERLKSQHQFNVVNQRKVELQEKHNHLVAVFESLGEGILTLDREQKVVLLNGAGEEMTGWSNKEASGKLFFEVFSIWSKPSMGKPRKSDSFLFEKKEKSGNPWEQAILFAIDGSQQNISFNCTPILDQDGGSDGWVIVFRRTRKTLSQ